MVVTRWSNHLTLLVTPPDVQGGQDCQALTSHIDLVPTLLALAGIDPGKSAELAGRALPFDLMADPGEQPPARKRA